jgi:hypothetical protein
MSYGKSWEKYPIEENEIYAFGNSKVSIGDLTKDVHTYMLNADMIYSDPPWTIGNVNMFNSKAGREYINKFDEFTIPLFKAIALIKAKVCYIEVGKESLELYTNNLHRQYKYIQTWTITYYKTKECYLIRGSNEGFTDKSFEGLDDEKTPEIAIKNEHPKIVADFCTGRGLTGIAANNNGVDFVGIELNKRKLAVFIDKANKKGYKYEKI